MFVGKAQKKQDWKGFQFHRKLVLQCMADQSWVFFNVSEILFLSEDKEKTLVSLTNTKVGYIDISHFGKS